LFGNGCLGSSDWEEEIRFENVDCSGTEVDKAKNRNAGIKIDNVIVRDDEEKREEMRK
jgi:hypothetical protein